jgi:nitrate/TMAO reductase-like tetraheme cytochrome c subunit
MIHNMLKYLIATPGRALHFVRRMGWRGRIAAVLGGSAVMSFVAIEVTGQPGFCNSCHVMNDYYHSWQKSSHAQVNCLDCHLQPGFTGYVKGKINGLVQAMDCAVGRFGTKPNATILDASCLRSECHSTEELLAETLDYKGVRFTHKNHIDTTVGGIQVTCGLCHSHFEGQEHFSVNNDACFTCHFLGGKGENGRLAHTNCRGCHELPREVIRRGFVKIDHQEFASYEASCEESCHKREIQQKSRVEETVCLSCHSFRKEADANSVELHASHIGRHKVECFACHGKVPHGQTSVESVSAMMDCTSCHSNTHQAQRTIYSTEYPTPDTHRPSGPDPHSTDRVLSPMFLTHVECTGCHTEPTAKTSGTLDSFGVVARAVPAACDKCHEPGTGQKYVSYWQKRVKTLYEQVDGRVKALEELARAQAGDGRAQELRRRAEEARAILNSVLYDGSWGVHNFKYTEALLLEAQKMASNGE